MLAGMEHDCGECLASSVVADARAALDALERLNAHAAQDRGSTRIISTHTRTLLTGALAYARDLRDAVDDDVEEYHRP